MIFDKHLNALKTLLAKGLNIEKLNLTVTIFIHMVIADAPARAKICNSKQFNGQYGCLHCLNPGTRFGRIQVYLDTNQEIRTNAHYLATLRSIRRKGFEHFGIKGPTGLTDLGVKIPNDITIDYMHACLEGTVKQLTKMWFESHNNFRSLYHIGNHLERIDIIHRKTRFPSEFPRSQSPLIDYKHFKANEYRSLIFYSLIYVMKSFMHQAYYEHLIYYILFIRLLTQDKISEADVTFSQLLINSFVGEFETLYGSKNVSFNIHSNVHLPDQVARFGPLNKHSSFAFEGFFKVCKDLFKGLTY